MLELIFPPTRKDMRSDMCSFYIRDMQGRVLCVLKMNLPFEIQKLRKHYQFWHTLFEGTSKTCGA